MKRIIAVLILVSSISLLSGCASIVDGTSQNVNLQTTPVKGASCSLRNNKGTWHVYSTPATVTVHRSYYALQVTCRKPGYKKAKKRFQSSTKGMMAGNIIFGVGAIAGGGVDAADGAAYDYPSNLTVHMTKK